MGQKVRVWRLNLRWIWNPVHRQGVLGMNTFGHLKSGLSPVMKWNMLHFHLVSIANQVYNALVEVSTFVESPEVSSVCFFHGSYKLSHKLSTLQLSPVILYIISMSQRWKQEKRPTWFSVPFKRHSTLHPQALYASLESTRFVRSRTTCETQDLEVKTPWPKMEFDKNETSNCCSLWLLCLASHPHFLSTKRCVCFKSIHEFLYIVYRGMYV